MTLSIDITNIKDSRGRKWDMTRPGDFQWIIDNGLEVDLPADDRITGHPLIVYFQADNNYFFSDDKNQIPVKRPTLLFNFFIPTSGWIEIDEYERYAENWRFRTQQVDFLISFFEHWEHFKDYNLAIGFCDESPMLTELVEQLYDCMNLYGIPKDRVMMYGQNFLGQAEINKFCKERKEVPIRYIVRWHMTGHIDGMQVKEGISHDYETNKFTYNDVNNYNQIKKYPLAFLNRRPSMARTCLLWGLFNNGVYSQDIKSISAFPPLKFFKAGKTKEDYINELVSHDYLGHILHKYQPNLLPTLNHESIESFKTNMRVGKSVPGDHDYIGDIESQTVPFNKDFYVWLTCETVADLKEPNLFYTEKILKPMVNGQALIVFSQQHFLQRFKKLGFHTLGPEFGINEGYDDEHDDQIRMKMVIEEATKIAKMDLNELHERWQDCKEKIKENKIRVHAMREESIDSINHFIRAINKPHNMDSIFKFNVNSVLYKYQKSVNINTYEDN